MEIDISKDIIFKFRITEIRKYIDIMCSIMTHSNTITALKEQVYHEDFKKYPNLKKHDS